MKKITKTLIIISAIYILLLFVFNNGYTFFKNVKNHNDQTDMTIIGLGDVTYDIKNEGDDDNDDYHVYYFQDITVKKNDNCYNIKAYLYSYSYGDTSKKYVKEMAKKYKSNYNIGDSISVYKYKNDVVECDFLDYKINNYCSRIILLSIYVFTVLTYLFIKTFYRRQNYRITENNIEALK